VGRARRGLPEHSGASLRALLREDMTRPAPVDARRFPGYTRREVRKNLNALEKRYPDGAPTKVVKRYNKLAKRDDQLVEAYNTAIDEHNAVLESDCDPE
jgi:hypothetical protein